MQVVDSFLAPSPSIFTTIFMKPTSALPFHCGCNSLSNIQHRPKRQRFQLSQEVRKDHETKELKIGSECFCWGGQYTILLCHQDNLVDAGFTAHPSKMKFPDDYDKIRRPLSFAIGDVAIGMKIGTVKDVKNPLEEKMAKGQNEVTIYPGAKHGFVVRADPTEEEQVKSAGEATSPAILWFAK